MKPIHKHDCDRCKFLGVVNTQEGLSDLYYNCSVAGAKYLIRNGSDAEYTTTDRLDFHLIPMEETSNETT